eukprot:m.1443270 g.1443270  ORF g.1443270 m.1443270 type:complete len:81 (-) comp25100_c0_seq2:180-422(-)
MTLLGWALQVFAVLVVGVGIVLVVQRHRRKSRSTVRSMDTYLVRIRRLQSCTPLCSLDTVVPRCFPMHQAYTRCAAVALV